MKFGIVVFPGTWSDKDTYNALSKVLGYKSSYIWHTERDIDSYDCIVLPGGFSYGDYLRCGAIAKFSPIMESIKTFSAKGKPVIGICNGFQILCEAGILPGTLVRNDHLEFRCQWTNLYVQTKSSIFSRKIPKNKKVLSIPISHGEGNYRIDRDGLKHLEDNNQIIFRYASANGTINSKYNPNGSVDNIAGITNKKGNVMGMMPHPEKASETLLGSDDGNTIFRSVAGD